MPGTGPPGRMQVRERGEVASRFQAVCHSVQEAPLEFLGEVRPGNAAKDGVGMAVAYFFQMS